MKESMQVKKMPSQPRETSLRHQQYPDDMEMKEIEYCGETGREMNPDKECH